MKKYIEIKKQGIFYNVYGDDAYVISSMSDYKITHGRIGFPINSLEKIKQLLDQNKISYIVYDENTKEEKNYKNNKYSKYLKIGKEVYEQQREKNSLLESIDKLSLDKIRQISKYVNYIIYK